MVLAALLDWLSGLAPNTRRGTGRTFNLLLSSRSRRVFYPGRPLHLNTRIKSIERCAHAVLRTKPFPARGRSTSCDL